MQTCTRLRLTLQNLGLRNVRLAGALQGPPIHKVKNYAVREFLPILVGWVWRAEVAKVEALDSTLLVVFRRTQDEVA